MLKLFIALFGVALILLLSEIFWRKGFIKDEFARKLVHICVGIWVAYWPWFISFNQIFLISLAFVLVVYISRKFDIFHAIHDVGRKDYGEVLYAVGIGLSALLFNDKFIFALAILHLAICDGLAAIIGKKYGKGMEYRVLGFKKTRVGSFAYFVASVVIQLILLVIIFRTDYVRGLLMSAAIIPVALASTAAEAASIKGLDNISIPLVTGFLLSLLTII